MSTIFKTTTTFSATDKYSMYICITRAFFRQGVHLDLFPNEYPGLYRHRPGHSLGGKNKVAWNEKWKKIRGFSYSKNMATFEGHFIKHKPIISEEWLASTKII